MTEYTFRVEMTHGQDIRQVEADLFNQMDDWIIFYRKPPQGGVVEYWRARKECVVAMETVRKGKP